MRSMSSAARHSKVARLAELSPATATALMWTQSISSDYGSIGLSWRADVGGRLSRLHPLGGTHEHSWREQDYMLSQRPNEALPTRPSRRSCNRCVLQAEPLGFGRWWRCAEKTCDYRRDELTCG